VAASPRGPLTKEEEEKAQRWREERRKNFPTGANVREKVRKMNAQPFETTNRRLSVFDEAVGPAGCAQSNGQMRCFEWRFLEQEEVLGFLSDDNVLGNIKTNSVCMINGAYGL
jgi:hypothetical protein